MAILGLAFLIGIVSGLRTFTSLASIAWAARLQWLSFDQTRLAFLGAPITSWIAGALALGELVGDKLPATPSRTRLLPFLARVFSGSFCGACMVVATHSGTTHTSPALALGVVAGAAGSIAGTLGGASFRAVLAQAFGRDFPAALLEDAIAIALAASCMLARSRV